MPLNPPFDFQSFRARGRFGPGIVVFARVYKDFWHFRGPPGVPGLAQPGLRPSACPNYFSFQNFFFQNHFFLSIINYSFIQQIAYTDSFLLIFRIIQKLSFLILFLYNNKNYLIALHHGLSIESIKINDNVITLIIMILHFVKLYSHPSFLIKSIFELSIKVCV